MSAAISFYDEPFDNRFPTPDIVVATTALVACVFFSIAIANSNAPDTARYASTAEHCSRSPATGRIATIWKKLFRTKRR